MAALGRLDGVEHHRKVAAGGVLHAHGDIHAAGGEPVLLVLYGPGAHRLVGEHVIQIAAVLGIEHLVGGGEAALLHHPQVQPPDGDDAPQQVRGLVRAGLAGASPCSPRRWCGGLLVYTRGIKSSFSFTRS